MRWSLHPEGSEARGCPGWEVTLASPMALVAPTCQRSITQGIIGTYNKQRRAVVEQSGQHQHFLLDHVTKGLHIPHNSITLQSIICPRLPFLFSSIVGNHRPFTHHLPLRTWPRQHDQHSAVQPRSRDVLGSLPQSTISTFIIDSRHRPALYLGGITNDRSLPQSIPISLLIKKPAI